MKTTDCSSGSNPQCLPPSQITAGKQFGTGLSIAALDKLARFRGGLVDGNTLVVAASEFQVSSHSLVLGVDLSTGIRRVISGTYDDASTGPVTVGSGGPTDLDKIKDVQLYGAGKYIALIDKGSVSPLMVELILIDSATGNRTRLPGLVFNTNGRLPCSGIPSNSDTTVMPEGVQPNADSLAVGTDSTVYLPLNDQMGIGSGLIALSSTGECRVVSLSGSNGYGNLGAGPNITQGELFSARFGAGKVWAIDDLNQSLFAFDPTSGNRVRVSSSNANNAVGSGPDIGVDSIDVQSNVVWSIGRFGTALFTAVAIDPGSGNRTQTYTTVVGPARDSAEEHPLIWQAPGGSKLVTVLSQAVIIFDPTTGNSSTLSY